MEAAPNFINQGRLKLYINNLLISDTAFWSIDQRKAIMETWQKALSGVGGVCIDIIHNQNSDFVKELIEAEELKKAEARQKYNFVQFQKKDIPIPAEQKEKKPYTRPPAVYSNRRLYDTV